MVFLDLNLLAFAYNLRTNNFPLLLYLLDKHTSLFSIRIAPKTCFRATGMSRYNSHEHYIAESNMPNAVSQFAAGKYSTYFQDL
jgi:hypothetical protein